VEGAVQLLVTAHSGVVIAFSASIALAQDGNEVIRLKNGQVLHLDVRDDIRENDEEVHPKVGSFSRKDDQFHDLGCLIRPHSHFSWRKG
jgi:hypothetical protein